MSLAEQYQPPVPSRLTKLLWRAAGADATILSLCPYGEQTKYACLGGIVAATGILAGVAGAYAFYTIFGPKTVTMDDPTDPFWATVASLVGLLWGIIIFNLDRYIVASTGKGDGTDRITLKEFGNAIPRIAMGLIISLTISKPLEIRIFKPEIDAALHPLMQAEKLENKKAVEARFADKIASAEQEIARLRGGIARQDSIARAAQDSATGELDGRGGSGRASPGPIYRMKQQNADAEKANLERVTTANQKDIAAQEERLKEIRAEQKAEIDNGDASVTRSGGLLKRIALAHDIAGGASLAITLIFVAIELTPIFFKLMIIKGPYDYLEENVKELLKARRGIGRESELQLAGDGYEVETLRFFAAEAELAAQRKVAEEQSARRQQAIEAWGREVGKQIEEDPSKFVEDVPPPPGA